MTFNLQSEIARVTERNLHDPDYWKRVGLPMPMRYLEDSIAIPESIRKDTERDVDEPDEEEDTSDWPDDHKLDDPRRGQAKDINKKGIL